MIVEPRMDPHQSYVAPAVRLQTRRFVRCVSNDLETRTRDRVLDLRRVGQLTSQPQRPNRGVMGRNPTLV